MKIRFEVHWFLQFAGSDAKNYFRVNIGVHQFRETADGQWKDMHTSSMKGDNEYAALKVAARLNEDAAYKSISMGLGQQMGFNSKECGYSSAKEMFNAYSQGENVQIDGMFSFIKNYQKDNMLPALKRKDYETFVRYYNGAKIGSEDNKIYSGKMVKYEQQYRDSK